MEGCIRLSHGDGGKDSFRLIQELFYPYFQQRFSGSMTDAFVFDAWTGSLAYTTDSFVVKPLFFRGGNIGHLAVCGTINDLVTAGAVPRYLSVGFMLEEGFSLEQLQQIVASMAEICSQTGVKIVTGDTKVVEKGSVDGVFMNTSGIGRVLGAFQPRPLEGEEALLITGYLGDHGTAILMDRYAPNFQTEHKSDCAPLCSLLELLGENLRYVKCMKDPTRGGLAMAVHEIAAAWGRGMLLYEQEIPLRAEVCAIRDILGIDPLYLACEGQMLLVVEKDPAQKILQGLQQHKQYAQSRIIGRVLAEQRASVILETPIGGKRILPMLEGQMLPRIC